MLDQLEPKYIASKSPEGEPYILRSQVSLFAEARRSVMCSADLEHIQMDSHKLMRYNISAMYIALRL